MTTLDHFCQFAGFLVACRTPYFTAQPWKVKAVEHRGGQATFEATNQGKTFTMDWRDMQWFGKFNEVVG